MKAFEIHTFQNGTWKMDSVFDDRNLAVHEAKQMDESGRFPRIRVIEEIYDATTNKTTVRTIYRGGWSKRVEKAKPPPPQSNLVRPYDPENPLDRGKNNVDARRRPRGHVEQKKSSSTIFPVLMLAFLVVFALAALYGLQRLQEIS